MTEIIRTGSEAETARVGARLAATLPPGTVVLLTGDLGAGKTAFVRGMAVGLGIDPAEVSSPTFTLIQEYRRQEAGSEDHGATEGARRAEDARDAETASQIRPARQIDVLSHVDLYRLEGAEIDDLGLDELGAGCIVAIEWAEKLGDRPPGAVTVSIQDLGGDVREVRITRNEK